MRNLTALVSLALAACSTVPAIGAGTCRDDGLGAFAGREATSEVGAEILRQSGANVLRWVPHGTVITMEFRADRVTVYLDSNGRIERVACG